MPYGESTVIAQVIANLDSAPIDEIVVVTGHHADDVESQVSGRATIVRNPDPDRGNVSSLRCGFEALSTGCDGVVVALGDMPGVEPVAIGQLVERFVPGIQAVVPRYTDGIGHPVVVSPGLIETLDDTDRQPLWSAIANLASAHKHEVPISHPKPIDINTPDDHREAIARSSPES